MSSHFYVEREDGLVLSGDPARLDRERVHAWLASAYWSSSRSPQTVDRSIENSLTYGVYTPDEEQIGLARAVTDRATFAWLGDVYVDETWRGKGVGRWLVGAILDHLREEGVPRFVLATVDAHGVYAPIGFTPLQAPGRWMEIDERPRF